MAKTSRKKMAKAAIPTAAERAARQQRDLLGRNVRQQRAILKLGRQLSSALKRSDVWLGELARELNDRLPDSKGVPSADAPIE